MSARRPAVVALVLVVFFVVSLFTNALGAVLPEIITAFDLSLTAAGLLPFSFFVAYALASIPAGLWVERSSEKRVMIASFAVAFVSAVTFAVIPRYAVAIGSLFSMGMAMAAIQVAAQPLLRVAGGETQFAFFSTLAQLVFGAASFVSPRVYTLLVERGGELPWLGIYWIFAALAALMMALLGVARLPRVERTDEERAGSLAAHRELLRSRTVQAWFVSIFMYVGSEQGIASWISQFLSERHGIDPRTGGASAVSWFWGLMTIGCIGGLVLLKLFDSRKVLIVNTGLAIVLLVLGLFGPTNIATLALPGVGLVASVMWPIIFSLALNSVRAHHGALSGILCTAIVGGAIMPLVIGRVGDRFGLRVGMCVLFVTFAWIFAIGFWAKPVAKEAPN
jgi:fucose permease